MARIEEIYSRVFNELPEGRKANDDLYEQIKAEIISMDCSEEEAERLEEIMLSGSSYGQASGFVSGFRFAMELMFDIFA